MLVNEGKAEHLRDADLSEQDDVECSVKPRKLRSLGSTTNSAEIWQLE